jgi:hypothetical protein
MGDPRSVPEIGAALRLFEAWEKAVDDPGAAELLQQAFEQLDDYAEDEHEAFVRNVRLANTRRLLNQLSRVRVSDLANWAGYSAILQSSAEAQAVIAQQPELGKVLDAFVDAHR